MGTGTLFVVVPSWDATLFLGPRDPHFFLTSLPSCSDFW